MFDDNGDGTLTREEFASVMHAQTRAFETGQARSIAGPVASSGMPRPALDLTY